MQKENKKKMFLFRILPKAIKQYVIIISNNKKYNIKKIELIKNLTASQAFIILLLISFLLN